VQDELLAYGAGLDEKPQFIALNKGDLLDPELMADIAAQLTQAGAGAILPISGATGEGVPALLDQVIPLLGDAARMARSPAPDADAEEQDVVPWSPL